MARSATASFCFACLALAGSIGCHSSSKAPTPERASMASGPAGAARATDAAIGDAVRAELHEDAHIDQELIKVAVSDGIVELTGRTDNPLSRERATRVAEAVRGVRSVSNRIEVVTPSRPDVDIERDVKDALDYTAATKKLPIHVSVKNQVATLTGTVGSWQEQQLAERVANGVRGVRFTQNLLSTRRSAQRDPKRIEADVKSRLAWDAWVEHDPLAVVVQGRKVTLSGTVGSAAEKTRATWDAWVDGVESVDAGGVRVDPRNRPDPNLRSGESKSNEEIARAIKVAALYDPRVEPTDFNVTVSDGVATLTGTVPTLQAKNAADALAANTVGVTRVENRLTARSQQAIADRRLQERIRRALSGDPLTDASDIHLAVKNGKVTVSGSVATFFESAEATEVASRPVGVREVDNELEVRDQAVPYVYLSWTDPVIPYSGVGYIVGPRGAVGDRELERRIKERFKQNPFILPEDVQVNVADGRATLSGIVHNYRERWAAAEAAVTAGAVSVENELRIE